MLCLHVVFSYHNHHTSKQAATITACFFLSLLVSGAPPCGFSWLLVACTTARHHGDNVQGHLSLTAGTLTA
jgi:hypothetical protein